MGEHTCGGHWEVNSDWNGRAGRSSWCREHGGVAGRQELGWFLANGAFPGKAPHAGRLTQALPLCDICCCPPQPPQPWVVTSELVAGPREEAGKVPEVQRAWPSGISIDGHPQTSHPDPVPGYNLMGRFGSLLWGHSKLFHLDKAPKSRSTSTSITHLERSPLAYLALNGLRGSAGAGVGGQSPNPQPVLPQSFTWWPWDWNLQANRNPGRSSAGVPVP